MHTSRLVALGLAVAGLGALAPAAVAATDHSISLTPAKVTDTVTGATATGFNSSWLLHETSAKAPAPSCGKDPSTMCETTLVHVTAANVSGGVLTLRLDGFQPYSDFDLKSFVSDAAGDQVANLGSPKGDPTPTTGLPVDALSTAAGDFETKQIPLDDYVDPDTNALDAYFLAVIPYFAVPSDSYKLTATLATTAP